MNKLLSILALVVLVALTTTGCTSLPNQKGPSLAGTYKKGDAELILSNTSSPFEYVYKEKGINKSKGVIVVLEQNKIRLNEQYRWTGSEWEPKAPVAASFEYIHIAANGQFMVRSGSDLKFIEGMWRLDEALTVQTAQSGETANSQTAQTGSANDIKPQGESYLRIIGTTRVVRINEQTVNWGADVGPLGVYASNDSITNVTIPSGHHTLRIRGTNWDNDQKHDTIEQDFEPGQSYIVQIRQYPGHGGFVYNAATGEGEEKRVVTLMPQVAVSFFPLNYFYFNNDAEESGELKITKNFATMYSLGMDLFDKVKVILNVQTDDTFIGDVSKLAGAINSKLFGFKFDFQTIRGEHNKKEFDEMNNTMVTLFYVWDIGIHNMPVEVGLFYKNSPDTILKTKEEHYYGVYAGLDVNGVEHNKDFLFWRMEAGLTYNYMYAQTQIGWGHDQYIGKKNALTYYLGVDAKYESWFDLYSLWSLGPVLKLKFGF